MPYCRQCGSETGGAKFCPSCGANQDNNFEAQQAPAQSQQYASAYQAPPAGYVKPNIESDMSVGDWIIAIILSMIPIVGFICLLVWAVSSSPYKRSRKNWAIAQFILVLIIFVIAIILVFALGIFASSN